jgi:hypothetical protein
MLAHVPRFGLVYKETTNFPRGKTIDSLIWNELKKSGADKGSPSAPD